MVATRFYVYSSHFLAKWGERMWEFAVALLLLDVIGSSILLVGAFGFFSAATTVVFGTIVGRYIDKTNRLIAVRNFFVLQNLSVVASAGAIVTILAWDPSNVYIRTALIVATIAFGSLASLGCVGSKIAMEKNWVPLMAKGDKAKLAGMNAVMRRIDLACKILAPAAVGFVIAHSPRIGAIAVAGWNLVAFVFEYLLARVAYTKEEVLHGTPSDGRRKASVHEGKSTMQMVCKTCTDLSAGWRQYKQQEVVWALWGLALLYFTVLSFGILMTAYLKWAGMPASVLGATRGIGAVFGVLATFLFPIMQRRIGLKATGSIAIVSEFVCLLPSVVAGFFCIGSYSFGKQWLDQYLGPYPTTAGALGAGTVPWMALGLMMGGVIMARFGLWLYDLAVSQLVQETVPENVRGAVSGFQNSLQSLFQMGVYLASIVDHEPINFGWLIFISVFMVFSAMVSYFVYGCKGRRVGGPGGRLLKAGSDGGAKYSTFEDVEDAAGAAAETK